MMADKLELTVDSYEQRLSDDPGPNVPTRHYSRGELLEPRNKEERERLVSEGIAQEPGAAQRAEAERLQAEADAAKAAAEAAQERVAAAEEQADAAASGKDDLDGLTKDDLIAVAEREGVDVDPDARKAEILDAIRAHRS
jgi:hypothetical protein